MMPSLVNNTAREGMAVLARHHQDTNFSIATTGSANAYVMAAARTITAYAAGQVFAFKASFANTGAATLNVDSVGAKALRKLYSVALVSGDIVTSQLVYVAYDAVNDWFQIISPLGATFAAIYQPLDSELTAIAALTSAADQHPYFTGSGTAALMGTGDILLSAQVFS